MTPTKTTLTFLKICLALNVLAFINSVMLGAFAFSTAMQAHEFITSPQYKVQAGLSPFFSLGAMILWGYCIYFYYKFDKYFKGGLALLFLPGLVSPFYFYKVIWQQKRPLQNK